MSDNPYNELLIADLFHEQPQPVFWMKPVWNSDKTAIIDFEYNYCNEEMYSYTGLTKEQLLGNRLFNSPALKDEELRKHFFAEILEVYQTGKKAKGLLYNQGLQKYYSFIRSKVQDGVLTIIQDRMAEFR